MSIVNECMIVNLQIGMWMGYRLDKEASRTVTEQNNAETDAARVNKHLIPKETLKPIQTAASAVRSHFYNKTLPWKDNGDRILTRQLFTDFNLEHARLVDKFDKVVEEFLNTAYLTARDQAEFRMGDLFKPEDYPSADTLRHKFYVHMDVDAVTTAGDFRVNIDTAAADKVRADIETAMAARLSRATEDIWHRLADTIDSVKRGLSPTGRLHESVLSNLEELVEVIPALNIAGDANLEQIRQRVQNALSGYDVADLRRNSKNEVIRATLSDAASEIMEDMKGFMSAFGVK